MKKSLTLLAFFGALFIISGKCGGKGDDAVPQSIISAQDNQEVSQAIDTISKLGLKEDLLKVHEFKSLSTELNSVIKKIDLLGPQIGEAKSHEDKLEIETVYNALVARRADLVTQINQLQPAAEKAKETLQNSSDFVKAYQKVIDFNKKFNADLSKFGRETGERLGKEGLTDTEKQKKFETALKPHIDAYKELLKRLHPRLAEGEEEDIEE